MPISVPISLRRLVVAVTGLALLGGMLVGFPASPVAAAGTPTVTITGFPAEAQVGKETTFSVTLEGFTASDSGGGQVTNRIFQVEMSVSGGNGTLRLATQSGTNDSPPIARDAAATIRFTGQLAAVNAAMTGMTYQPDTSGNVDLTVSAAHIPVPVPGTNHDTTFDTNTPVRWVSGVGANNHFYEFVQTKVDGGTDKRPSISWIAARDAAAQRTLLGQAGYLVTLTSAGENAFVADQVDAFDIWIGASDDVDQIFTQENPTVKKYASQALAEGNWHWVTGPEAGTHFWKPKSAESGQRWFGDECSGTKVSEGEPVAGRFQAWACGEPNNASHTINGVTATENFAVTNWNKTKGRWNDLPFHHGTPSGFLVEYGPFSSPIESADKTASTTAFGAACGVLVDGKYEVSTAAHLENVGSGDGGGCGIDAHYVQTADITLAGDWTPIGFTSPSTLTSFTGTYDGQFHSISGLKIRTVSGLNNYGLFASINNATVKNLRLVGVDIDVTGVSSSVFRVGAISGEALGTSKVLAVSVATDQNSEPAKRTSITAKIPGSAGSFTQQLFVGGVVGHPNNSAELADRVSFIGDITVANAVNIGAAGTNTFRNVGGIAGRTSGGSKVSLAYSRANITIDGAVNAGGELFVGTAIGSTSGGKSTVQEMYSTGSISDSGGGLKKGIIGQIGLIDDEIIEFYYPDNLSLAAFGAAPTNWAASTGNDFRPLAEASMKGESARTNMTSSADARWNFNTIWATVDNDFPIFRFELATPGTTVPGAAANAPTVSASGTTATVSWLAPADTGIPGGSDDSLTYTVTSTPGGFTCTTTALSCQVTGLELGETYTFTVSATNSAGTGLASPASAEVLIVEFVAPAPTPTPAQNPTRRTPPPVVEPTTALTPTGGQVVLPPSRTPTPGTAPAPLAGPLPGVSGNGGQAPLAPTALIGGRLAPVNTSVVNQNQVNLQTGGSSFGVSIPQGQGSVAAQGGNTELAVQSGAQTRLSGSGLFPGSTVQVFMPLGPNGSREIAQLPVGPSGNFDGDAAFTTRPTDPPLPVGRNVLQIASLNEAGERVIVEMAINIAQSAPAPEILRTNGEIPGLTPGDSLATRAGQPVDVRLTVDSTSRLTTVEGDGWTFSVDVSGDGNSVEETADGGALISVLRGGEASISGNGFMPLTRADIWLFSDPTLLGSVDIDENGEFNGTVIVDGRVVPVGDHTLQIQGVGVDGFVLAANLGVVVNDPEAESTATTEQAAAGVLWWVVTLIVVLVIAVVVWSVVRRRRGQAY